MEDIDIVLGARKEGRRTALDFIKMLVSDYTELHGDRYFGDDKAIIGGIGWIDQMPFTIIGNMKGKYTEERIECNFGMARPEGYRKSLRLMKLSEKCNRPILNIVDTAGAYCGIDAEERGQGRAIADNLFVMSGLKVPIISIIIGEGGSGGALALCHSDKIWMLNDAYFSVVSPESCSNILWKTTEYSAKAASSLALTAGKLYDLQMIDKIIPSDNLKSLKDDIVKEATALKKLSSDELVKRRYKKFRIINQ